MVPGGLLGRCLHGGRPAETWRRWLFLTQLRSCAMSCSQLGHRSRKPDKSRKQMLRLALAQLTTTRQQCSATLNQHLSSM